MIDAPHNSNLPRFPIVTLTIATIITMAALAWFGFYTFRTVNVLKNTMTHDFKAIELKGLIIQLDEILTMSARMGVSTGDGYWEERYNHYDPILTKAIEEASLFVPIDQLGSTAKKTNDANIKLVAMEHQAFTLTKKGQLGAAQKIIFGSSYETQKKIYAEGMALYGDLLKQQANSNIEIKIQEATYSLVIILISVISLVIAWLLTYKGIYRWKKALDNAKKKIEGAREQLEYRVQERTAELSASQNFLKSKNQQLAKEITERKILEEKSASLNTKLVIASRLAGMADIATSVVHNIGNALNSVVVSTAIICEKVAHSKISNISKLAELLSAHTKDIESFITKDPKGQEIPKYLSLLSETWNEDKAQILAEANVLSKSVEHIKEIIVMQQSFSGAHSFFEETAIEEIVNDAIMLNKINSEKYTHIEIMCDYKPIRNAVIDKVKLLHLIVNLIKNSIESLIEFHLEPKQLTLRVQEKDSNHFMVQVIDNGVGISSENKTKIFSSGFTTKKTGSGFGLHTSSLAAQEMGGNLSADSDGIGKGATFTLVLPYLSKTAESQKLAQ